MKTTGISLLLLALLSGCVSQNNKYVRAPIVHKQTAQDVTRPAPPKAPKKYIKLKEVDDNNFNDKYMYPEDSVKKETAEQPIAKIPAVEKSTMEKSTMEKSTMENSAVENPAVEKSSAPTPVVATGAMTKEECIAMISQEKFDKYSQMFGNENASIKRCIMLKAMNK